MEISFDIINKILIEEDIEGLIESGAPDDEYSSEARDVLSILASMQKNQLTQEKIVSVIVSVWTKSFNHSKEEIAQRVPAFENVARKLVQA